MPSYPEEKEGRLPFAMVKPGVCWVVEKNIVQVWKVVFGVSERMYRLV
jgi:hypothetical protein